MSNDYRNQWPDADRQGNEPLVDFLTGLTGIMALRTKQQMQEKKQMGGTGMAPEQPERKRPRGWKTHGEIVEKTLYYNREEGELVGKLTNLLTREKYDKACRRLQGMGMRAGFACLFYGEPGTGKTETVLQMARKTGRHIMQVEMSQMRSKWMGDSEKNVKRLFEDYRYAVRHCPEVPILLLNEADALIGKRKENERYSTDRAEHIVQNILLQEMETMEGIMIATTNMAQSMDPAFERRFLFKVKFQKPSEEVRCHIWQSMLPELPGEVLRELARDYDFSGGQIENVVRQYAINDILNDCEGTADDLRLICRNEQACVQTRPRIGFQI